jgi:hypothetical protein
MRAPVFDFQRRDKTCSTLCNLEQTPIEGPDRLLSKEWILKDYRGLPQIPRSVRGSSRGAADLPLLRHFYVRTLLAFPCQK